MTEHQKDAVVLGFYALVFAAAAIRIVVLILKGTVL